MVWFKNSERLKKILSTAFSLLLTVCAIYIAIKYSAECSQGILSGLTFCVTVLVPSLFIFMVIASFLANSKVCDILGRFLGKPVQKLFKLPRCSATAIILSLIGGYPVGARCVASLFESGSINKEQAKKLSLITVCAGPSFVLNFVGNALLNSKKAGYILLISQIISFFIIALLCGRFIKVKDENIVVNKKTSNANIVEAVENGCKATINMCAMVVVFSAIISVCDTLLKSYTVGQDICCAILEVTTACNRLSAKYPLYVISFLIGFAGISVHFQIFSALKSIGVNKFLFFSIRILQGIIACAVTYILLILFPITTEVFSTTDKAQGTMYSSVWGCVALILTAICFLNSLSYTKIKRR